MYSSLNRIDIQINIFEPATKVKSLNIERFEALTFKVFVFSGAVITPTTDRMIKMSISFF